MRRLLNLLTLTWAAGTLAIASPLVGASFQSSCTAAGSTVTGAQSCLADPSGTVNENYLPRQGVSYAYSSASVTTSLSSNPAGFSDVRAVQMTALGQGWSQTGSFSVPATSATSQAQFGEYLTTEGPVRSGYLQIVLGNNSVGNPSSAFGAGSFSISLLPTTLKGYPQSSALGCGISYYSCSDSAFVNYFDRSGGFAVSLGTPFLLSYSGMLQSFAGGYANGNGSGILDLDLQFRFFEADGVTPVGVTAAAPEPATVGMLGLSLAAAMIVFKRRRVQ